MKTPQDVNRATNLLARLDTTRKNLAAVRKATSYFRLTIGNTATHIFEMISADGARPLEAEESTVNAIRAMVRSHLEQMEDRIVLQLRDPDAKPAS